MCAECQHLNKGAKLIAKTGCLTAVVMMPDSYAILNINFQTFSTINFSE